MRAPMASRPRMCRSTGREPMAQPPGKATSAYPKCATIGPSTRMEARTVFTSSYGASRVLILVGFTSTLSLSPTTGCTPMRPNNSIMVVMSCRCGRLQIVTASSASRVAARIGKAEFLAPEMRISPSRRLPPVIINLSIRVLLCWVRLPVSPGLTGKKFHGDRMDAAVGNRAVEQRIDLLLTLDRRQRRQFVADQQQLEIAALAVYFHLGIGQLLLQQILHFTGLHGVSPLCCHCWQKVFPASRPGHRPPPCSTGRPAVRWSATGPCYVARRGRQPAAVTDRRC